MIVNTASIQNKLVRASDKMIYPISMSSSALMDRLRCLDHRECLEAVFLLIDRHSHADLSHLG